MAAEDNTTVVQHGQQFTLIDEVATLDAQLERLREHRDGAGRAAQQLVGSQQGHAMSAKARVLSAAITEMEGPLLRLKDLCGMVTAAAVAEGQPVHGSFEVTVTHNLNMAPKPRADLMVWPGKPIVAVLNEAIVLLGLEQLAGTWGIWRPGTTDPVQELSVGDARIEPGEVLELRRA